MANEQNLKPFTSEQNREEAAKNGHKGGIESGKTRRLQGAIKRALESKASSAEFEKLFNEFDIEKDSRDYASAIGCVVIQKAAKGDLAAITLVRDTIGEKPAEDINLNGGVVIVDDIPNPSK